MQNSNTLREGQEQGKEEGMDSERSSYMKLLIGMATDELMGRGPTPKALISNLRTVADNLEKMLPNPCDEEGRPLKSVARRKK
jgi:hypothetical protein